MLDLAEKLGKRKTLTEKLFCEKVLYNNEPYSDFWGSAM